MRMARVIANDGITLFLTDGEEFLEVIEIAPRYVDKEEGIEFSDWKNGILLRRSDGKIVWLYQHEVELI